MSLFNDYVVAVFGAVNAIPALTGKVSERLANNLPFPKVWIEDGGAGDWSNKDDDGLEAFINLHVGSRYDGSKEIRELMDACHAALHDANLTLANGQSVLCRYERHDIVTDSDGITRHGVMRFVLLISEVT